jgi:hypothetical protein
MEAAASPSCDATPRVPYQIIDALMARAIQADVERTHPLFAWIIMRDLPEYPGALAARLVTDAPTHTSCLAIRWPSFKPNCHPGWCEQNANRPSRRRWLRSGSRHRLPRSPRSSASFSAS